MTDDLDDLKAALQKATPAPDIDTRAAHLTLAQQNFDALQGNGRDLRPNSDRPTRGLWTGALKMLNTLTSRPALTATTALVAVGLLALFPVGSDLLTPTTPGTLAERTNINAAPNEAVQTETRTEPTVVTSAAPEREIATGKKQTTLAESDTFSGASTDLFTEPVMEAPVVVGNVASRKRYSDTIDAELPIETNTEAFANAAQNPLQITTEQPVSTFSIDVDTASYAVVRNALMNGFLPDPQSVRIEEMINYFPYAYPAPTRGVPFEPSIFVSETPWNPDTRLVHIGIQGAMPDIAERPPLNLVFLIDTSGSMNQPNKLPLLKQSFRLMLGQLRPTDQVAIVTYAGSAGQVLEPTPASDRDTILAALSRLDAGGSTAGQAGLQQAYATAGAMADDGEITRVILATDGDFNVGFSNPEDLKRYIETKRETGTYLSVLGFGRGNLDDATMQALAQNGNGQAAYIDTLSEAQKVLVDQLTGALFPIANDVKVQVEFNPAQVAEYRLIGYETRALNRTDFANDAVDAGDIGAGHSVTAIYEITPVGSPARRSDPLRYQPEPAAVETDEIGHLRLRYKTPGSDQSQLIETPILPALTEPQGPGFAVAIAGYAQLLTGATYTGDWGFDDAIALANSTRGEDPFGYRTEAVNLMRLAQSLSE